MAAPGRRPLPTALKVIKGNPGKRQLNENEPEPDHSIPDPPDSLSDAAREQWDIIAPQLHRMGVLSKIDAAALEMYCVAFGNWRDAQQKIKEIGPLIKTKSGYFQQSPYMQIANKSFEQMRSMLAEFGMTPSSRSRLSVGEEKQKSDNYFANLQ